MGHVCMSIVKSSCCNKIHSQNEILSDRLKKWTIIFICVQNLKNMIFSKPIYFYVSISPNWFFQYCFCLKAIILLIDKRKTTRATIKLSKFILMMINSVIVEIIQIFFFIYVLLQSFIRPKTLTNHRKQVFYAYEPKLAILYIEKFKTHSCSWIFVVTIFFDMKSSDERSFVSNFTARPRAQQESKCSFWETIFIQVFLAITWP